MMGSRADNVAAAAKGYGHVLIVMRHAKAEPYGPTGDYDRPLAERGRRQAKAMGRGLLAMGLSPDRIACSAATRTVQTCERMLRSFGDKPVVDYRQGLYEAGMQAVMDELAHTKDAHRTLMVLGHEPTMSIASQWLASPTSDPATRDLLGLGLSTASVAVFGSDLPFARWRLHEADLLGVLTPNDVD